MGDRNISTGALMDFLKYFKVTIENKFDMAESTDKIIEEHLGKINNKIEKIDKDVKNIAEENK